MKIITTSSWLRSVFVIACFLQATVLFTGCVSGKQHAALMIHNGSIVKTNTTPTKTAYIKNVEGLTASLNQKAVTLNSGLTDSKLQQLLNSKDLKVSKMSKAALLRKLLAVNKERKALNKPATNRPKSTYYAAMPSFYTSGETTSNQSVQHSSKSDMPPVSTLLKLIVVVFLVIVLLVALFGNPLGALWLLLGGLVALLMLYLILAVLAS